MSFQKCPKCNGKGTIDSRTINVHLSTLKTEPKNIVYEQDPCPLCLGEFVIHEEQGVPPSKMKMLIKIDQTRPKVQIDCDCAPQDGCQELPNCSSKALAQAVACREAFERHNYPENNFHVHEYAFNEGIKFQKSITPKP